MHPTSWKARETRARLSECEPWPRYYEFRAAELRMVRALCTLPSSGVFLEIGCGNGFQSFLLRDGFSTVIGTDIPESDPGTHSPGLWNAVHLQSILGFEALRLVASTGERVPLRTSSVDFVFSSNVLEHVQDQRQTAAEIWRVLKTGGRALIVVPAAMERVYNLPISYVAIIRAAWRGLRAHAGDRSDAFGERGSGGVRRRDATPWERARRFFKAHYPTFPFPKPHGNYPSSSAEFLSHLPLRWERLMRQQGFHVERTFTTVLAPHTLGLAVSEHLASYIAELGWPVTRTLGGLPLIKWFGTTYAMLVVKGR